MGVQGQTPSAPMVYEVPMDFSASSSSNNDEKGDNDANTTNNDDASQVESDEERQSIIISTLEASPIKVEHPDHDTQDDDVVLHIGSVDGEDTEQEQELYHLKQEDEPDDRLSVQATEDVFAHAEETEPATTPSPSPTRRFSKRMSESVYRRSAAMAEKLPGTPTGWAVFVSALVSTLGSALLGYELQLQKSLTASPLVFGQVHEGPLRDIFQHLTETPQSILRRVIQPTLFVGTRGIASSMASYFMAGPAKTGKHLRFREIMSMTQDGAQVGIDWELPAVASTTTNDARNEEQRKQEILNGPIRAPVVLILHGINNDASFGYVKSLMRACCDRGWVAAGMNFRGCGGVPLTTPRVYNGAYTGDIRCVVHRITARLVEGEGAYLFLVGNSLGANLVTKYLGEEGLSGTLSPKVAGAVSLGNPTSINSNHINALFSPIMALGVKKASLENWSTIRQFKESNFQSNIYNAMGAITLGAWDEAMAPCFIRNSPEYPFSFRIGYKNGQSYWTDASSYRLVRYISVPTLQIMAADDLLCYNPFLRTFTYSLANPNVMLVETRCGGHLGWQESPPEDTNGIFSTTTSWSDVATTDFIQAVLRTKENNNSNTSFSSHATKMDSADTTATAGPRIQSRL